MLTAFGLITDRSDGAARGFIPKGECLYNIERTAGGFMPY